MTAAQEPLWAEPEWTERWQVGTRVRNRYTGAEGVVESVEPGRRLLIRWKSKSPRWPDYLVRHGSDLGLEVAP